MAFYAAYHQDARNKATHFIGVPAIMLSLFIPLAWLRFEIGLGGVTITAAMLFAAVVLAYYFMLDMPLALAMFVVTARLVWGGEQIADLGAVAGLDLVRRSSSSAAGSCSSSATSSRAASPRSPTTCSRSSSRRSFSPPRYSSPWGTSRGCMRPCRSARCACGPALTLSLQ